MIKDGTRFGNLTILYRNREKEKTIWKKNYKPQIYRCRCDCGNEIDTHGNLLKYGTKRSCGCENDLTGKTFNNLYVECLDPSYVPASGKHKYYLCKCLLCGNIVSVRSSDLKSGIKKDCGCMTFLRISNSEIKYLTGKKFGHLTVVERDMSDFERFKHGGGHHPRWICKCDLCGGTSSVSNQMLMYYGKDRCTKCIGVPIGEAKIAEILEENGVTYLHDRPYKDCKFYETGYPLYFDFIANPEEESSTYIIEFDGVQHFKKIPYWDGKIDLNGRIARDEFKNNWCKSNNIPLIRIPHTHLKDVCYEDLNPKTSKFLVA